MARPELRSERAAVLTCSRFPLVPHTDDCMHDFVIIGSGVSGSRIADELTAGGATCVLLEAGRAYDRRSFPANEFRASTALYWGGGIEVSRDARLGFLRASAWAARAS